MPPLPDVSHVLRARLFFTLNGKPEQGVRQFYRWTGTTPTPTALATLAHKLYTAFVGETIAGAMYTSNKFVGVQLEDLTSTTGATGSFAGTTDGTLTGEPVPVDACFVSSFEIPRRYRGGHPRSYWPFGYAGNLTSEQEWSTAAVAAWQTLVTDAIAAFVGQSSGGCTIGAHCVPSYYKGFTVVVSPTTGRARNIPKLRTTPIVTDVTDIIGRHYVGSFRRRRPKTS